MKKEKQQNENVLKTWPSEKMKSSVKPFLCQDTQHIEDTFVSADTFAVGTHVSGHKLVIH